MKSDIFVATRSPRRIKILSDFGFRVKFIDPCPEISHAKDPKKRAIEKAKSKIECLDIGGILVGFDTVVSIDNEILEKPRTIDEAKDMLLKLSGGWHSVITGMVFKNNGAYSHYSVITRVKFTKINEDEINLAFLKYNPLDKAGAYAIQEFSGIFVERIEGDYYNVVGLPVARFYAILRYRMGLKMENILCTI